MARIFGPRDYLRDETLGDVAQQAAQINRSRFDLEGAEARRGGFQQTFAPEGSLQDAFAAKGAQEQRIALQSRMIEGYKAVAEIGQNFGTEGANEVLGKLRESDPELAELFSDSEVTNVNLDGTFDVTAIADDAFEDSNGNQIKKGEAYLQRNNQDGQQISVNRIGPAGDGKGKGKGTGGGSSDIKKISDAVDAQISRILGPYSGARDAEGLEIDPTIVLQERADAGDRQALEDLKNINNLILSGQEFTRGVLPTAARITRTPDRRSPASVTTPRAAIGGSSPTTPPLQVTPQAGVANIKPAITTEDALSEAVKRGLVR